MLLIDKYIMNDAMNYEVAEEVAIIRKFIKTLIIFKALGWWPLFIIAATFLFYFMGESFFDDVLKFDTALFIFWVFIIRLVIRPIVIDKFCVGNNMKKLKRTLAKYAQRKHLKKIKILEGPGGWLVVTPLANYALRKVIKLIRLQKVIPKRERWTVVVCRERPVLSKRKLYTY